MSTELEKCPELLFSDKSKKKKKSSVYIDGQTIKKREELVGKGGGVIGRIQEKLLGAGNILGLDLSDGYMIVRLIISHYTEYLMYVVSN